MTLIQQCISAFSNWISAGITTIFASSNILFVMLASAGVITLVFDIIAAFLHTKDD